MRTSIIIATHNEGQALARTIRACVETCGDLDYEILVADDASMDGSLDDVERRFTQVRVHRHEQRQGASPTKAMGAHHARGDVLVFLDAHTKPEHGAIPQLVQDVKELRGTAILTPAVPTLDVQRWTNDTSSIGNGYACDLSTFTCRWLELTNMQPATDSRRLLYESPALIGCALAITRELYDRLRGFDTKMKFWGVEDLDFGLKCWILGHRILHDPKAVIGHRFRTTFDNYPVPVDHVVANQIRMAYKHFTLSIWSQWLECCRLRNSERLAGHPEGLWARAWQLFQAELPSADEERRYLQTHRVRDELWYADRFSLTWPRLAAATSSAERARIRPRVRPSVGPRRKPSRRWFSLCALTDIIPANPTVLVGQTQRFNAQGTDLGAVRWSAPGGTPASGTGSSFTTQWNTPGVRQVTAGCNGASRQATVTVASHQVHIVVPSPTIRLLKTETLQARLTPDTATATNFKFELKRASAASWTQLANGPSSTFLFNAKIVDHFNVRVTATINGQPVISPVQNLEVQFPSFSSVVADTDVQEFTDGSWQSTSSTATPTSRREENGRVEQLGRCDETRRTT